MWYLLLHLGRRCFGLNVSPQNPITTRIFFVNTDAISSDGNSSHDLWIDRSVVLTGGRSKYKEAIARIPVGARVLVYVNDLGVVAVGQTATDTVVDVKYPETVNPAEPLEYHRAVFWLLDLRNNPISRSELIQLLGQGPLRAVQEVRNGKEALLGRLAILEAEPTSDAVIYHRVASELCRYGYLTKPSGTLQPCHTSTTSIRYSRDPKVRAWTLNRAKGCCELCDRPAPFLDEYQQPYLESHHIETLATGGADTPGNTAALCANCHRELHHAGDRDMRTKTLSKIIAAKEYNAHEHLRVAEKLSCGSHPSANEACADPVRPNEET